MAAGAVAVSPDRPVSTLVHDAPGARLVVFRIAPGQRVAPHTSPSTVVLSVVSGSGLVSGRDGERAVSAGTVVTFEPNELHGMRATDETMVILAVIAPRP
ncbi:MAG: AraC family ligand binding domain-containing protein [Gemmatimonadaceae bacterium]|nr:AraC family ligand binding domain-containing protein [Gemmatimonadaceae bacterium]